MSDEKPTPAEDLEAPAAPAVAADPSEPKEKPEVEEEEDEHETKNRSDDDDGSDDDDSDDDDDDSEDEDDEDEDDDEDEESDDEDDDSEDEDDSDEEDDEDDEDDEDEDERETSVAEAAPVAEVAQAAPVAGAEPVIAETAPVEEIVAELVPAAVMGAAAPPQQVTEVVADGHAQHLRLLEALVFAGTQALDEKALADRLPNDADLPRLLADLAEMYANRGVNLVKVAGGFAFRTAPDLSEKLKIERPVTRKLSRASIETLAIIAYHQPVTRAEIEQVRGVGLSKGTLDLLFEQNWIKPMGRRRAPGKPVTWGTTDFFLEHFGLPSLDDLPGQEELKAAGLLDARSQPPIFRPEEPDLPLEPTEDEAAEPLSTEEQGR
jgi:segregation and condensation protein B